LFPVKGQYETRFLLSLGINITFSTGVRSHIAPIVIHETPTTVYSWSILVDLYKKYFMGNEMQNNTENSPLTPPVMHGRTLDYATKIEGFRSEISKAGLSLPIGAL
jgi:hypothetical protein